MEKNLIFAGVGFSTNSRTRPGSGLLLLRSLDFIEIPQRIITDGYHLVIARRKVAGRAMGEVKCALSFDAVELLVGAVFVHGTLGSGIIAMNPSVKMIGAKQYFLAMPDIQFGKIQQINELGGHKNSFLVVALGWLAFYHRR
jgi:hypothetical protein